MSNRIIRILCLHGYRQDKDRFEKGASGLVKKCNQNGIELVCADAPYKMETNDRGFSPTEMVDVS